MTRTLQACAVGLTVLAACHRGSAGDDAQASGGEQAVVGAATAVATTQAFPQVVRAIGTVTPRPGRFAELAAPAATRVAPITPAASISQNPVTAAPSTAPRMFAP